MGFRTTALDRIHALSRPGATPPFVGGHPNDGAGLSDEELLEWDDSGSYGVPPNLRDAADDNEAMEAAPTDDYGNPNEPAPRNVYQRFQDAMAKRTAHAASAPQQSNYKPGILGRIGAAAANFGAGYVNAGGRVRVDPHAMDSLNDSLMRPGYRQAQQKWNEQRVPIDAELAQAQSEVATESAQSKAENDARRVGAYERAQGASEAYNQKRAAALDRPEWKMSPNGRYVYDPRTGEKKQMEQPPEPPPMKETPTAAMERRSREVEGVRTLTDAQKEAYVLTGKIPAPPKPAGKGKAEKPRMGRPGEFQDVEERKESALEKLEAQFNKDLQAHEDKLDKSETKDGETSRKKWADERKAIEKRHEEKKRSILGSYDRGVKNLGGSVPTKYTEAEVRARAIALGKDPNESVAAVASKGLLK